MHNTLLVNMSNATAQPAHSTYSSLNPSTCRILICFTMVLFPDSPAPAIRNNNQLKYRHKALIYCNNTLLQAATGYLQKALFKCKCKYHPSLTKNCRFPSVTSLYFIVLRLQCCLLRRNLGIHVFALH